MFHLLFPVAAFKSPSAPAKLQDGEKKTREKKKGKKKRSMTLALGKSLPGLNSSLLYIFPNWRQYEKSQDGKRKNKKSIYIKMPL